MNTAVNGIPADPRFRGMIPLDPAQLEGACGEPVDHWAGEHVACLLLTHAPISWLAPESRRAYYSEIVPPFRFAFHLCSRFDPSEPLCARDGPTLVIQAPPFRAEDMDSGYIAGKISFEAGPEAVTLRPRRYEAGPRARFVPDTSYSSASLVGYHDFLPRSGAPIPSRCPPVSPKTSSGPALSGNTRLSPFGLPFPRQNQQPEAFGLRFLEIHNFRCIDQIGIDLEPPSRLPGRWTCLAGINGAGKTSILQALALVLLGEPLYRELGGDRLKRFRRMVADTRQETWLRIWGCWGTSQSYLEVKHGERNAMATWPAWPGIYYPPIMRQHWDDIRSSVVLAYGATRNLSDYPDNRYTSMSPDVRKVMTLFDPLTQVASAEFLLKQEASKDTPLFRLFESLLRQIFGNDLGFDVRDDRVVFTDRGESVEPTDLPDGFRSSIAWLVDLCATWCEKNARSASEGKHTDIEAIVLIDEIDLHLHPSLQRTLVPRLREALPRVQWIVTTHSPLVLSSFDTSEIVALDRNEPGGVRFLDRQILGFTTDQIYTWLMGTRPTSAAMEQELAGNETPGADSEEELDELLMMSPEVSADEAKKRARERRERLKRLGP